MATLLTALVLQLANQLRVVHNQVGPSRDEQATGIGSCASSAFFFRFSFFLFFGGRLSPLLVRVSRHRWHLLHSLCVESRLITEAI